jgi:hypothetical protein
MVGNSQGKLCGFFKNLLQNYSNIVIYYCFLFHILFAMASQTKVQTATAFSHIAQIDNDFAFYDQDLPEL